MFFVDSIVNQYSMVVQGDKVLICNYLRTEVDVNVIQSFIFILFLTKIVFV